MDISKYRAKTIYSVLITVVHEKTLYSSRIQCYTGLHGYSQNNL